MKALTLWQPWASLCVLPKSFNCPLAHVHGMSVGCRVVPFKTIETRSWPAPKTLIGQRIAIHAAKRPINNDGVHVLNEAEWPVAIPQLPLGAIVGTTVLTDCVPIYHIAQLIDGAGGALWPNVQINGRDHATLTDGAEHHRDVSDQRPFGDFRPGRWAWLLADVDAFATPIGCNGRQGIWNLPDDLQWLSAHRVVKS